MPYKHIIQQIVQEKRSTLKIVERTVPVETDTQVQVKHGQTPLLKSFKPDEVVVDVMAGAGVDIVVSAGEKGCYVLANGPNQACVEEIKSKQVSSAFSTSAINPSLNSAFFTRLL